MKAAKDLVIVYDDDWMLQDINGHRVDEDIDPDIVVGFDLDDEPGFCGGKVVCEFRFENHISGRLTKAAKKRVYEWMLEFIRRRCNLPRRNRSTYSLGFADNKGHSRSSLSLWEMGEMLPHTKYVEFRSASSQNTVRQYIMVL